MPLTPQQKRKKRQSQIRRPPQNKARIGCMYGYRNDEGATKSLKDL